MGSSHSLPDTGIESVVITPQLRTRPAREIDFLAEHAAFRELADLLATDPDKCLDRLVELGAKLCNADTTGISLEEIDADGSPIFRWVAMAGTLKSMVGGKTPRHFSPCGVCVDINQPLLMDRLDRHYKYFQEAPLPFVEALLLPWGDAKGPVGTVWAVTHTEGHKFDLEDARVMGALAAFAYGALRLKQYLKKTERTLATAQVINDVAHEINNPLQGAMLAVALAGSSPELDPETREIVALAERELKRVAELSAAMLRKAPEAAAEAKEAEISVKPALSRATG